MKPEQVKDLDHGQLQLVRPAVDARRRVIEQRRRAAEAPGGLEGRCQDSSLLAFTQHTRPNYRVNWHHKTLAKMLDRVAAGDCRRLMVFMPPQHGKSELVSRRFPASNT